MRAGAVLISVAVLATAACGSRAPLTARPEPPLANDHGLSKIGPCLEGAEADRKKLDVPPSLIGRLVGLYPEAIAVEPEHSGAVAPTPVDVPISDGTVLCTVSGGFVRREELAVGQHVAVWLPSMKNADLGAVAVMLASTKPEDDWPDVTP